MTTVPVAPRNRIRRAAIGDDRTRFLLGIQELVSAGGDQETSADSHGGQGDAEKIQHVGPDEGGRNDQEKTIEPDLARHFAARRFGDAERHGMKDGRGSGVRTPNCSAILLL